MAMSPDENKTMVLHALPDAQIDLVDLAGDGDHYRMTVTSAAFDGKSQIEQHQMVYRALGGHMMGDKLHALSLSTKVLEKK